MNPLIVTLVVGLLSQAPDGPDAPSAQPRREPPSADARIENVYSERSRIRSCEILYTVTYNKCDATRDLEGTVRHSHVWFEGGGDRKFRVDYRDEGAKVLSRALNSKYSRAGGTHRVIDSVGRADVMVREVTREYEDTTHMMESQKRWFDPRLMGVFPMPSGALINYKLDVLRTLHFADPPDHLRRDAPAGDSLGVISCNTPVGRISYAFEVGRRTPVRMEVELKRPNGDNIRTLTSVDVEIYRDKDNTPIEFPRKITHSSWKNDVKDFEETLVVQTASFNSPVGDPPFTWRGLEPDYGTLLLRNEVYKDYRGWDGEDFTIPPKPIVPAEVASKGSGRRSLAVFMLANGTILLLLLVVWVLRRRKSGVEPSRPSTRS